jgi:hypothetical protein
MRQQSAHEWLKLFTETPDIKGAIKGTLGTFEKSVAWRMMTFSRQEA